MNTPIETIFAVMPDFDRATLRKYAAAVTVDGDCLEIGSGMGASAVEILKALPNKYELICSSHHNENDYQIFMEYCIQSGVWDRVIPVKGDFRNLMAHKKITRLAFLFLDHDHSYLGMKDALEMIIPLCVNGTILMFHDYNNGGYPAVKQYVDRLVEPQYSIIEKRDGMAVLRCNGVK